MARNSAVPARSAAERRRPKGIKDAALEHLRHIHRMTQEQQIALVEEARAARPAEQARRADFVPQVLLNPVS